MWTSILWKWIVRICVFLCACRLLVLLTCEEEKKTAYLTSCLEQVNLAVFHNLISNAWDDIAVITFIGIVAHWMPPIIQVVPIGEDDDDVQTEVPARSG